MKNSGHRHHNRGGERLLYVRAKAGSSLLLLHHKSLEEYYVDGIGSLVWHQVDTSHLSAERDWCERHALPLLWYKCKKKIGVLPWSLLYIIQSKMVKGRQWKCQNSKKKSQPKKSLAIGMVLVVSKKVPHILGRRVVFTDLPVIYCIFTLCLQEE